MSYAILLRETGGPDKLRYEAVEVADPGPAEILIRQTVIGVNFHDSYVRSGLYNTLKLPGIPGLEGAAVLVHLRATVPTRPLKHFGSLSSATGNSLK
jgi:NADPH2:quinone reductase